MLSALPVMTFASSVSHVVTSVAGHVYSLDFDDEMNSWDSCDPQELFSAPVIRKPCKGSICKQIVSLSKGVDFVVLWMDCDREGENIK